MRTARRRKASRPVPPPENPVPEHAVNAPPAATLARISPVRCSAAGFSRIHTAAGVSPAKNTRRSRPLENGMYSCIRNPARRFCRESKKAAASAALCARNTSRPRLPVRGLMTAGKGIPAFCRRRTRAAEPSRAAAFGEGSRTAAGTGIPCACIRTAHASLSPARRSAAGGLTHRIPLCSAASRISGAESPRSRQTGRRPGCAPLCRHCASASFWHAKACAASSGSTRRKVRPRCRNSSRRRRQG